MQRVHGPVRRNGAAGRHQRLAGHLAAEDPLPPFILRAAAAEDVKLDLLKIEQLHDGVQRGAPSLRSVPFRLTHPCLALPRNSSRNLDGFRLFLPVGVLASDQDRNSCSLALVIPTESSRLASSVAAADCAYTIGIAPSVSPGRNTASHSSPFAACIDASVTPPVSGACPVALRCWSSATRSSSVVPGAAAKK